MNDLRETLISIIEHESTPVHLKQVARRAVVQTSNRHREADCCNLVVLLMDWSMYATAALVCEGLAGWEK